MRALFRSSVITAILCAAIVPQSQAINIQLEYGPETLFAPGVDTQAKTTIAAAAADLSAAITSVFNSVTTDAFTGTSGSSSATLGFQFDYADPQTGNTVTESSATLPGNTVRIRVGTRNLPGSTRGEAGPANLNFDSGQTTGKGILETWPTAVSIASSKAGTAYSRGGGPTIGNVHSNWPLTIGNETATGTIDFDYGATFGGLALDNELNVWHYDYTTQVATGKTDLYSVSLHEMMHVLGLGTSNTWNSLVSGSNWLGSEVISLFGSGTNLIASPNSHVTTSVMSPNIINGQPQKSIMTANIDPGQRRYLTTLDLAFLRDLGYSTIEPTFTNLVGDFDNDGDVDNADLTKWKSSYALNGNADADGDGDTDGKDFLLWQRHYGDTNLTASSSAVPEPSAILLCAVASLFFGGEVRFVRSLIKRLPAAGTARR